jgi:hypothetical protein
MVATIAVLVSLAASPIEPPIVSESPAVEEVQSQGQPGGPQEQPQQKERPAGSDVPADEKKPPTPEHTGIKATLRGFVGDVKHLPTKDNAYLALLGGGLALAAHPVDETFNARLRSHNDFVNSAFVPAKYVGDTGVQVALSLGTYAAGRIMHAPKASHLGMDLVRAQMLTEMLVQTMFTF